MSSVCISSCVNDTRVPVRATYRNLYKWPESDAEFVKSMSSANLRNGVQRGNNHPRVVDSISCRQIYLRSYTFSKKESVPEKTTKCFGRAKDKVVHRRKGSGSGSGSGDGGGGKKGTVMVALYSIFHRLLSCTARVDVVDH